MKVVTNDDRASRPSNPAREKLSGDTGVGGHFEAGRALAARARYFQIQTGIFARHG
jgi:hypothetical protein